IAEMADYLKLPAGRGTNTLNVLSLWTEYWKGQKAYMTARQEWFENIHAVGLDDAMDHVWDGDGSNPNAALTIFRHTDSAFVMDGLHGDFPETAWIIDYPLFERIHYLLVAGFDVYGSAGHQLNTRIVMDFLRMEGENNFLAFLPVSQRKTIRDSWYQGIRRKREKQFEQPMDWLSVESVIDYKTDDPQRELYGHLQHHLGTLAGEERINRCATGGCTAVSDDPVQAGVEQALGRIAKARGSHLQILPDATFLRVRRGSGSEGDLAYTLILNKDYSNLTSMLEDEDARSPENDTLTVIPGFAASYPNFFLAVEAGDIEAFADRFLAVHSRDDYERFVALYGLRRTNTGFWAEADWFQAEYRRQSPVEAGIFDLNRYRNR
ncbi:MAG: fatty acid cis/trans isomerase, partial [Gammaproteobacteria bacterium]|nr:fatty acid cis/trans isomerase [Gammaproteobacteria bacterium]